MHFAMKTGKMCFSLRKFLAISLAIQKIASDCGCDAVVHLDQHQNLCNTKKILRGIHFVKITENMFQPPAPKETKNTTSVWRCQLILIAAFSYKKKSVAATNSRKKYKKNTKKKTGRGINL